METSKDPELIKTEKLEELNNEEGLLESLRTLFNEDDHKDFKFVVEGHSLMAHKAIVAARCKYFKAMLDHDTREKQTSEVNIDDCDKSVFEAFLKYIYTDEVDGMETVAVPLMILADKYSMRFLKDKCEKYLAEAVSSSDAIFLLIVADRYNCVLLKREALSKIQRHIKKIKETQGFKKLRKLPWLYEQIIDSLIDGFENNLPMLSEEISTDEELAWAFFNYGEAMGADLTGED